MLKVTCPVCSERFIEGVLVDGKIPEHRELAKPRRKGEPMTVRACSGAGQAPG